MADWSQYPDGTACGEGACSSGACVLDFEWANWPLPPESPTDYTDNGDGTVRDNVTGLLWQKTISSATYLWAAASTYCSALNLGGELGWRVPSTVELLSIVDWGKKNPTINSTAFPGTPPNEFWASRPTPSGRPWKVWFENGTSFPADSTTYPAHIRCVWTPLPQAQVSSAGAPAGRYTIATETVKDNETGLTWQRGVAPSNDWAKSHGYCQALNLGGFNAGWRLPSVTELESLIDRRASSGPMVDLAAFPNTPSVYFWTSVHFAAPSTAVFAVGFGNGMVSWGEEGTSAVFRCVR